MVIAIIGILASIALPSYQSYVYRAKAAEVVALIDKIHTVLATVQAEEGATLGYPLELGDNRGNDSALVVCRTPQHTNCKPVAGLNKSDLKLQQLGIYAVVSSGIVNTKQPGQYKVSLNVDYSTQSTPELRSTARQIILATHHVMKPATYKDTITRDGSANLYFQLGDK